MLVSLLCVAWRQSNAQVFARYAWYCAVEWLKSDVEHLPIPCGACGNERRSSCRLVPNYRPIPSSNRRRFPRMRYTVCRLMCSSHCNRRLRRDDNG